MQVRGGGQRRAWRVWIQGPTFEKKNLWVIPPKPPRGREYPNHTCLNFTMVFSERVEPGVVDPYSNVLLIPQAIPISDLGPYLH